VPSPKSNPIARIADALGLRNVRSLRINAEAGDIITATTVQYVTGDKLAGLADELERKEWVLVPRDEVARLRLTDAERGAITDGIHLCEGEAGEANENVNANAWAMTAGVLRGLLERLG
jgi:hypothetical protein